MKKPRLTLASYPLASFNIAPSADVVKSHHFAHITFHWVRFVDLETPLVKMCNCMNIYNIRYALNAFAPFTVLWNPSIGG